MRGEPPLPDLSQLGAVQIVPALSQGSPGFDPQPPATTLPFSHYLWILRRHAWKIATLVVLSVVATLVVSTRLTPIYEATATVDVDRQAPSGVVGQDAQRVVTTNDADQFLATQAKLIQSDSVLRPVTQKYNLLEHERQLRNLRASSRTWPRTLPSC